MLQREHVPCIVDNRQFRLRHSGHIGFLGCDWGVILIRSDHKGRAVNGVQTIRHGPADQRLQRIQVSPGLILGPPSNKDLAEFRLFRLGEEPLAQDLSIWRIPSRRTMSFLCMICSRALSVRRMNSGPLLTITRLCTSSGALTAS
jgi:hypothetical protein